MRKTKMNFKRMLGVLMAIAVLFCVMTAMTAQISAAAVSPAAAGQALVQALQPAVGDTVISSEYYGGNTNSGGITVVVLIFVIVFLVLALIAVVVVVLVVLNKKKNNAEPGPNTIPSPAPTNAQSFNHVQPGSPYGAPSATRPVTQPGAQPALNNRPQGFAPVQPQAVQPTAPVAKAQIPVEDGAGDTTVLGVGSEGFILLRKNGNEKIHINKAEFYIGKEQAKVDYCIKNNNSISRRHAKIRVRAGKCYISDLGSTNCTYINGTKLSPNQEIALIPGDEIKLSNEEFEFIG